ncbi:MAG: S49 family peptidase [Pseudomonadota bacterium]
MDSSKPNWEQQAIVDIANQGLKEQRRSRRWGIFFKILGFAYLFLILSLFISTDTNTITSERHTALVDMSGLIAQGENASADFVTHGLRSAFESENSAAVILRINSPGGSPVQAAYINTEMKRLREKYPTKPLYVVISDICASGGIYAAVAGDKIFANESSIVGSIGVRMDGFGFVDTLKKLGIERRLMTAGDHKAILDPFSPEDSFEKEHVQNLLDEVHEQFIEIVKEGRGDKLVDDPAIFSGLFWTGTEAMKLGLVDGFGSAGYVAREVVGVEDIVDYTYQEDFFTRFAKRMGSAMATQLRVWMQGSQLN